MSDERRIENIVNITDTLWQLNRSKKVEGVEKLTGTKMPDDCMKLAEYFYRAGAVDMERAIGGKK